MRAQLVETANVPTPIFPSEWEAWCDGSSLGNPGPAGWAIYVRRPDGSAFRQYGSSKLKRTNNEAELHALLNAVRAVPLDAPAVIHADSTYAIDAATTFRAAWTVKGMRKANGKPVANPEMVKALWMELDLRPLVRLEHCRGHAGDPGNEMVDGLARTAAEARKAGGKPMKKVHTEIVAKA